MNASELIDRAIENLNDASRQVKQGSQQWYGINAAWHACYAVLELSAKEPPAPPLDSDDLLSMEWCEEWLELAWDENNFKYYKLKVVNYQPIDDFAGIFLRVATDVSDPKWSIRIGVAGDSECHTDELHIVKTPNELRHWMHCSGVEHRVTEGL